jgi:hypothetical protein
MWSFGAAGLAPGGIEIQDHDFAFIVCQRCSLIVIKRPASPARRLSRATGGDDTSRQNKSELFAGQSSQDLRFGVLVLDAVRTRWLFGDVSRIDLATRNAIFLAGPLIEINQLASFRTERSPRVVLPFNRLSARRTFRHKAKVRRNKIKVKRGIGTGHTS